MTGSLELEALRGVRARLSDALAELDRMLSPEPAAVSADRLRGDVSDAHVELETSRLAELEEQLGAAARRAAASFAAALPGRVAAIEAAWRRGELTAVEHRLAELRSAATMFAAGALVVWVRGQSPAALDESRLAALHLLAARTAVAIDAWVGGVADRALMEG